MKSPVPNLTTAAFVRYLLAAFCLVLGTLLVARFLEFSQAKRRDARTTQVTDGTARKKLVRKGLRARSHPVCQPAQHGTLYGMNLYHQDCPAGALAKEGESFRINDEFLVTAPLARRVNFWRKIYSVWSANTYVLHSSTWPEVALESGQFPAPKGTIHGYALMKKTRRLMKQRRGHYRKILQAMHHNRHKTPTGEVEKRIARLTAHIKNPNKYRDLAWSLRLQRGQKDFIRSGVENASIYLPHIEKEFRSQGIPVSLSRIAYVESSFNLKAYSKAGASGIYQLMPFTGREYLRINKQVDERRDPVKSARAAAQVLKANMKMLGNWPLAVTAYNHGPYGIRKGVRKAGSTDLIDLIHKYKSRRFGFASQNFYSEFLAALMTVEHADQVFADLKRKPKMEFANYRLPKGTTVKKLVRKFNLSVNDLGRMNPDILRGVLRYQGWLPKGYVVKVPVRKITLQESS